MKTTERFKNRIVGLLTTPGEELGRWARFVRFQIQLWRFCARRLHDNNSLAMSSALSFRTLFALIPALVLALLVMNSFQVLGDPQQQMRNIFDWTGISQISTRQAPPEPTTAPAGQTQPASASVPFEPGENKLDEWITETVTSVESKLTLGRLGPAGTLVLIWTALTLLTTMERSLNRIFGARRNRSIARRLGLYWSALTLGPVMLAAGIYLSKSFTQAYGGVPVISHILAAIGWAGPILVGVVLVAGLYKLMPNTRVSFRAALGGAILVVPLWMLAKWGFALYVRHLTASIYGALGLIPLFLFWVNTSWLIFLFGAEVAHTAVSLSMLQAEELAAKTSLGPTDLLAAAVAVAKPFRQGKGPTPFVAVAAELNLPDESVARLLDRLVAGGVLVPAGIGDKEAFAPARPTDSIPVATIMEISGPLAQPVAAERYGPNTAQIVARASDRASKAMANWTLADLTDSDENSNDQP